MLDLQTNADLAKLVQQLENAMQGDGGRAQRVCGVLAGEANKQCILNGLVYQFDSDHYRRELLYADPQGRFSLLALIWQPGQVTPLHGHQAWCAVAVHTGELVETAYEVSADRTMSQQTGERCLQAGSVTYDETGDNVAHRIANHSSGMAISLHVYGVPAERVEDGVNVILDG